MAMDPAMNPAKGASALPEATRRLFVALVPDAATRAALPDWRARWDWPRGTALSARPPARPLGLAWPVEGFALVWSRLPQQVPVARYEQVEGWGRVPAIPAPSPR